MLALRPKVCTKDATPAQDKPSAPICLQSVCLQLDLFAHRAATGWARSRAATANTHLGSWLCSKNVSIALCALSTLLQHRAGCAISSASVEQQLLRHSAGMRGWVVGCPMALRAFEGAWLRWGLLCPHGLCFKLYALRWMQQERALGSVTLYR